jgi:signal transduction histidine kinase
MPAELQNALMPIVLGFLGIVGVLFAGVTAILRAVLKRQATRIEQGAKWEQEQLEMRLKSEAQQRQIAYEQKMAEIEEKADMRAALDRQSQQLENAVNAIVDIAKSDSRKTEVLAANTNALSANTQTIEIFGDRMNDVVELMQHTEENVRATRKAAEIAISEHKLILSRLDTLEAKQNNIIALFMPSPALPIEGGKKDEAA